MPCNDMPCMGRRLDVNNEGGLDVKDHLPHIGKLNPGCSLRNVDVDVDLKPWAWHITRELNHGC